MDSLSIFPHYFFASREGKKFSSAFVVVFLVSSSQQDCENVLAVCFVCMRARARFH